MKPPLVSPACYKPAKDRLLHKILLDSGTYYHSAEFFYQELWRQRLLNIGWRVLAVERLPYHPVWDIRLRGTLAAQVYLLLSKPVAVRVAKSKDPLCKQFECEIREIAKELGPAICRDCVSVIRTGTYFRVSFIWPRGKPGRLVHQVKKPVAFTFLIQPWLRKNRN